MFRGKIDLGEFLRNGRKYGITLVTLLQSVAKTGQGSAIGKALRNSCRSIFFWKRLMGEVLDKKMSWHPGDDAAALLGEVVQGRTAGVIDMCGRSAQPPLSC